LKKETYDSIIVADKGMEFCYQAGLKPDQIVGDFDSGDYRLADYYENQGVLVKRLKPEKDDSDTQSALHLAMEAGAQEVILLGGTGTRLDHVWANIQLLAYADTHGISMKMYDGHNAISLHRESFRVKKATQFGTYTSFFSLGDCVENLTLEGFKYPLKHHMLRNTDSGLTVSNEILESEGKVLFDTGLLVMLQSRD
jgi:thiamine pyrophosphokinase